MGTNLMSMDIGDFYKLLDIELLTPWCCQYPPIAEPYTHTHTLDKSFLSSLEALVQKGKKVQGD